MTYSKRKVLISAWWIIQLCGLFIIGIRHLGHLFVFILLSLSIAGFILGRHKITIIAAFGLASYSALTFFFSILFVLLIYDLLTIALAIIAIINLIISFWSLKKLNESKSI